MVLNVLPFIIELSIFQEKFKFSYDTIYFFIWKEGNNTMVNEKRKVNITPLYLEKLHMRIRI